MTRVALKQSELDAIQRQIYQIQTKKEDRALQKALIGTLFIWFEKCNGNLIPAKQKISIQEPADVRSSAEPLLPPMPKSVRNKVDRERVSDMIG